MPKKALTGLALLAILLFLASQAAFGQVEAAEVLATGINLEPGANAPMIDGPPTDLGDGAIAFTFKITDSDTQADDPSNVIIHCFLVQNLGSATETEITSVMIVDGTGTAVAPAVPTAAPGGVPPATCPAGAPPSGNIIFEAFIEPAGGFAIPDNGMQTFGVAVQTAPTGTLLGGAQGKSVRLRVILQYTESIGSPPTASSFTLTIGDSDQDFISNSGINELTPLSFTPTPIKIGAAGVVSRFRICDRDGNAHSLVIDELILVQGALGSALINDFEKFELYMVSGAPQLWGGITSSDAGFTTAFNRGGAGIILPVTVGPIPDEQCRDFEIRATPAMGALKGRVIHLRVTISTEEPSATDIDPIVDKTMQTTQTIMLGSGVVRVLDLQAPGGNVPIEVVGFSAPGLGRIDVQTHSVQFDATVIHIQGVTPVAPYQVEDVVINNRLGTLKFSLFIDPAQIGSAKMGIPAPEPVAFIQVVKQGQPGQKSPLIMQVDRILDADNDDLTKQVGVISGSVILPLFGDVDQLGDGATLKDVLLFAQALLSCFDNPPVITGLSDAQKFIADVANPKAPSGQVPDCATLSSADLLLIAQASIELVGSNSVVAATIVNNKNKTQAEIERLPGWLQWLAKNFPSLARIFLAEADLSLSADVALQLVSLPETDYAILKMGDRGRQISGLQGQISFEASSIKNVRLEALNHYEILASKIDLARGELSFVVMARPGEHAADENVLKVRFEEINKNSQAQLDLNIQFLLDSERNEIPFKILSPANSMSFKIKPVLIAQSIQFSAHGAHGAGGRFSAQGQGIESIEIEGFDLSGEKRFAAASAGSVLYWNGLGVHGDRIANGIYLVRVTVRGAGNLAKSEIKKILILR